MDENAEILISEEFKKWAHQSGLKEIFISVRKYLKKSPDKLRKNE